MLNRAASKLPACHKSHRHKSSRKDSLSLCCWITGFTGCAAEFRYNLKFTLGYSIPQTEQKSISASVSALSSPSNTTWSTQIITSYHTVIVFKAKSLHPQRPHFEDCLMYIDPLPVMCWMNSRGDVTFYTIYLILIATTFNWIWDWLEIKPSAD